MTFGELKTQFTSILNRRDITVTLTDTFFSQALLRIQRELRAPLMEAAIVTEWAEDQTALAIPNNYLKLITITVNDGLPLVRKSLTTALGLAAFVAVPETFARRGAEWILGPTPAVGDECRIDYYQNFDALVADADENSISVAAPDMLIYAALSFAADHYQDNRAGAFEGRYISIRDQVQGQADDDELSGRSAVDAGLVYDQD